MPLSDDSYLDRMAYACEIPPGDPVLPRLCVGRCECVRDFHGEDPEIRCPICSDPMGWSRLHEYCETCEEEIPVMVWVLSFSDEAGFSDEAVAA